MPDMEIEKLQYFLLKNVKRGNWEAVVAKYEEAYEEAQKLQLTREGNTVLHLAVINNQEEIVEKLVKLICKSTVYFKDHLEATNERGNNPLHLAAALGSARMCHVIASAHEDLVNMRNDDGETPLFLAAVHGHKNVFYCLYYFCRSDLRQAEINCRRDDGDTVLHVALGNEQLDLAYQIIHVCPEARHWVDVQGFTSLHVLATKPTCFKSGAKIWGWWRNFFYNWISVDQLEPQSIETLGNGWKKLYMSKAQKTPRLFPDNYETCIQVFLRLWDAILKVVTSIFFRLPKKKKNDEAKMDKDSEKGVIQESENHERLNTELFQANQYASEPATTKFPENYSSCSDFFKIVLSCIMIILGFGFLEIRKIQTKKQKHTWSIQVMEKLLELTLHDKYCEDGKTMGVQAKKQDEVITYPYYFVGREVHFSCNCIREMPHLENPKDVGEAAILLAAKNGVLEIVMAMFEYFPAAIFETRESDKKNVVLLAAEHKQSNVYKFLLKKKNHIEILFRAVDKDGNSALHLAASKSAPKVWHINDALQMQWKVEWFKFVKNSLSLHTASLYNKKGERASRIFEENSEDLVKNGKDWLHTTSQSCSVVATLIATVAFATAATIPGSYNSHGAAILQKEPGFFIFAISSLIALSLSTTSVIIFLAILTAKFDMEAYFGSLFPWKLLFGLSSLYFSIILMLISFCSGHYFLINHSLQNKAVILYALAFLPVAFIFGIMHLPLYFDLLLILFKRVPKRSVNDVNLCD